MITTATDVSLTETTASTFGDFRAQLLDRGFTEDEAFELVRIYALADADSGVVV